MALYIKETLGEELEEEKRNMLSDYARAVLNTPRRIRERDEWFARMTDLFEGRGNSYNSRYVFTLAGYTDCMRGGFTEQYTIEADMLRDDFAVLSEALKLYDDETAVRRLRHFAKTLSTANRLHRQNDGIRVAVSPQHYLQPEQWVEESLELLALKPETAANRFAPACIEYGIYGVHFIDRILGARVFFKDGQWNADYLKTPIGALEMPDLEKDETWNMAKRAALAFVEADVKLPLFGMPTLSSALNILLNLYGQEALVAILEDEEAACHDLNVVNTLIRTLHKWYRDNVPSQQLQPVISTMRTQPPGYGQLCGCTTQLLSGPMYREFIMPLDDALLGDYQYGGMIHLCGSHTQHIENFRDMPHLKALQLNDRAAGDLEQYFHGLREDQIIYLNPCNEMPLERALEITGGKRIVICQAIDAPIQPR